MNVASVPFYLSFVGMLFPSDKDTVGASLQTSKCEPGASPPRPLAHRCEGSGHNAPGLPSLQSFVFFPFHSTCYLSESWQETALTLMAQWRAT